MKIKFSLSCVTITFIICTLLLSPCNIALASDSKQKEREKTYKKLELFSNILSILQENYVEEIDTEAVIDGAINGLLLSLDPHSSYLTPSNFQDLQDETQGNFTGIGIEITIKNGKLTIVSPIEDTPAYRADLKANDIIVKIDGNWTKNMSPMEAVKKLRGPKGSSVTISVQRKGWDELKEFTLVRDIIPLKSVRSFVIEENILYTRVTNFQSHTTKEYLKAIKERGGEQKINGIILDLRSNPGGLLNQAVSIADIFIDQGLIVYTKGRTEDQNMVFQAKESGTLLDIPLILLVNEGSASASEIVAGAIQDHRRGIVIGTTTFGKGSVQTIVPLQDGAGLRMTTARYFTPNGRSIQAKGITPDIQLTFRKQPKAAKKSVKKDNGPRESNLPNHIKNKSQEIAPTSSVSDSTNAEKEISEEVENRLAKDNQLRMAVNILKSITLLTKEKVN